MGGAGRLRIGAWEIDRATGEMVRGTERVRLEPRALRLLLELAEHVGETVSIGALLDAVWPDVTVSQDSVYQAIASLRRLLGDEARRPSYIVTVPRRGYRLVAPLSSVEQPTPWRMPTWSRATRAALALVGLTIFGGVWAEGPAAPPASDAARGVRPGSIAVLPFFDLTGASRQRVADGVTEELIGRLSRIPGVRVPAPRTAFAYRGNHATATEIAQALHVSLLLDGSVRESGGRLRVAVQLIRGANGFVLWSDSYDRPAADSLKAQDDVATAVAKALGPCLARHARLGGA
jgi:transcriptional activator of cad operon